MITDVESLTRLDLVFPLAQRTRDGSCSCRKSGCARPGAHPLLVLSPRRAWLFTTAVTSAGHRPPHARPLPAAQELVMLPAGAWVPLPPTHLPREGPVRWNAPPQSAQLPASSVHRLIAALLAARNRLIRTGDDGLAPSNSDNRHREA